MKTEFSFWILGAFLLLWGPIGFVLGTMILLGPVRWWARFVRARLYPDQIETAGVLVLILLLVVTSALLAWIILQFIRKRRIAVRVVVAGLIVLAAGYVYSLWMDPTTFSEEMRLMKSDARVTFGPFPTEAQLLELKEEGYTVVSLLHPAVVPFEPQLINQEREMAAELGVPFIHIPMLPWVSSNEDSLERVKALLEDETARYYVHCYLGKDRVQIVKRVVEEAGVTVRAASVRKKRSLDEIHEFERGGIFKLGSDGWVIPYPTDEEITGYLVGGQVRQVIALLDPDNPSDSRRIEHERALLERYDLPFEVIPVGSRYDPEVILDAAQKARRLPKPFAAHAFFSPPEEGSTAVAEAFIQAYMTGKPPLPPSFFDEPFSRGKVDSVAPNVAVGPRPTSSEFGLLARRGVETVIFVGSTSEEANDDRRRVTEAGMEWVRVGSLGAALRVVSGGGPYYLYGADQREAVRRVASEYGPALPLR